MENKLFHDECRACMGNPKMMLSAPAWIRVGMVHMPKELSDPVTNNRRSLIPFLIPILTGFMLLFALWFGVWPMLSPTTEDDCSYSKHIPTTV
jgi:hypothetical protein